MRRYVVWCPDHCESEDDARAIEAHDAEDAAEKWAEKDDCESAEYAIVGGDAVEVRVRDVESAAMSAFEVSGESIPSYHAKEVEP